MISCRRIAQFVSKNRRSIFYDALKLSPITAKMIQKIVDDNCKKGRTKTKNLQYQMLNFRNLQVLQVTDPPLNADPYSKPNAGCCIVVGAGTEDSPDKCLGLLHLLEHLVTVACYDRCPTHFNAETCRFKTFYGFEAPTKDIVRAIKTYATVLFAAPQLEKSYVTRLIDVERGRLDNEFHQTRALSDYATFEILKSSHVGLQLTKFMNGNETSLKLYGDDLIKELVAFRKLYRQRRVAICIYSPEKLKMKTIVKSLNVGDFLIPKSTTAPLRLGYEKRKDCKDMSKTLIAVKYEYDGRLLKLIFPIMNELNIQESNTFRYIIEMIECSTKGFLTNRLRFNKLATTCSASYICEHFVIDVELTVEGLKQIKYVNNCIRNFLQFLHDKWETNIKEYVDQMKKKALVRFNSLSNERKAQHIVSHLDGSSKKYDEMDLYKDLGVKEAKELISTYLLKNENTVHMIYDHNPTEMLQHLKKAYGDCLPDQQSLQTMKPQIEPIFSREFYVVPSTVFEPRKDDPQAGLNPFEFVKFNATDLTIISYPTTIFKPEDVAFQKLFGIHLRFFFDPYNYFLNASWTKELPESFLHYMRNEIELQFLRIEWTTNSAKEFSLAMEFYLGILSSQMCQSETLAESLMTVIVNNLSNSLKIDPLPLQLDTLLNMDYEDYCQYLGRNRGQPVIPRSETDISKYFEMKLHTMNRNEGVTATLVFYQTSHLEAQQQDMEIFINAFGAEAKGMECVHAIYTLKCNPHNYNNVRGFLCKILSVESKHGQDSESIDVICQNILEGVEARISLYGAERFIKLKQLFDSMTQTYVKVQVVGHKEPMINAVGTFKEQFESWLKDYQEKFNEIRNLK